MDDILGLFDHTNVSILILDSGGVILYCNRLFCDLTGIEQSTCNGRFFREAIPLQGEEALALENSIRKVAATGRPSPQISLTCPFRVRGSAISRLQQIVPIKEFQGHQNCVGVVFELVSEESISISEVNESLRRTEKMMALGNLMAGLAHEIKTPLGSIVSNTDVIQRCLTKMKKALTDEEALAIPEGIRQLFDKHLKLISNAMHINEVASQQLLHQVNSLKHFLRFDEEEFSEIDLQEILEQVLVLTHHLTKNRIAVVRDYQPIPRVPGSPGKLGQVLLNLVTNAIQAMPGQGRLTLATLANKSAVIVRIKDTGEGIPPENLERIFSKGFTTKRRGMGTGLGLAISLNIMKDHGGSIEVESRPGQGSTFSLRFPLTGDTDQHAKI
ncbi:MAG: PAS domain-containing protein [Acidobacteria bacterium]|nr:PAS domain-containing protein [Acidobacteriota bacterium]